MVWVTFYKGAALCFLADIGYECEYFHEYVIFCDSVDHALL